jgi:peptidoglycan hydrolase-like protein with peptidoglycan-binding domain
VSAAAAKAIGLVPARLRVPRRARTRILAGAGVLAAAAALVAAVADPFGVSGPAANAFDNGSATGTATVTRQSLSSQTQVSATLGYASAATIVQPAGTSPATLLQAEQQEASARGTLATAQAGLAVDTQALERDRATLAAGREKQRVDCSGVDAASGGAAGATPCAADVQAVATAEQAVTADETKVGGDRRAVASAGTALAGAQAGLAAARSSATSYGQSSSYTRLPAVGAVVKRGESLYDVDGRPVVLLYGHATAWRAFAAGMSPGRDVAQLNANLRALGYGPSLSGDAFTAGTSSAVAAFQRARGLEASGTLLLGSIVFEPGAIRVTSTTPSRGAAVQPGAVLGVTSTSRSIAIALDAAEQASIAVGDPVTITLPDNSTTPGRVSYVGTVATVPTSSDPGGSSTPTIEVDVTPTHPAATGRLDQAPVSVSIVTDSVRNALVVPVNALLALGGGGYAIEEIDADGAHRLLPVELGLFDDSNGLVQVTGTGVTAGMRIVVPSE